MNGYGYRCCVVPMRCPLNFPWMDCLHNLLAFSRYHLNDARCHLNCNFRTCVQLFNEPVILFPFHKTIMNILLNSEKFDGVISIYKMFLIYVFLEFLICSYTLAWTHGDNLNMISMNDSIDKDVEKLSHGSVLDSDVPKPKSCHRPSTCVPVKNNTCFGVRLPYTHTSLSLTGASNLDEHLEKLEKWRGLMHVPRCWAVIQPFLCSLYMPKCDNNTVFLPSKEMCEITRHPCRILIHVDLWPEEFKCDSYESKCKNNVRELKFNTTGRCKFPLVHATREASYYESIEGCGVQCHNPYFSEEERQDIKTFVKWCSFFAFFWNLFAVMTFVIDWRASQKYPTRVIFFMNVCFLLDCLGYMYQFLPWTTDASFCHKDGTLRTSEPSIQENVYCVTHFIIVYYFFMAGLVWFNILAYTWLLRCKTIGTFKLRNDQKRSYYHIVAWSAPFVMVVTISALNGVDGDGLLGICFVSKQMRPVFLLGPLLLCSVGVTLFVFSIATLLHLKMTSKEVTSENAKKKICESIVRLLIFLSLSVIFIFITFVCQLYELQNQQKWKDSFRRFIVCQLGVIETENEICRMSDRPGVLMVQLQLIAIFGLHINAASWLWTCSTVQAWSRFIEKKFLKKEVPQPDMLTKHEIIARAYAKRKQLFDSDGRLSISIFKSRQDPVGLDFELNSVASNDLSSTWAKVLPQLIKRRGALTEQAHSNSSQRRNSVDSQISISVRRFSIESQKRNSFDSTVSVQAVEVTKTVRKIPRSKRRRKERMGKCESRKESRRNSNTSQTSNLEMEILAALKIGNCSQSSGMPNTTNRRLAITNIAGSTLKLLDIMKNNSSNSLSDSETESCNETDPLK